MGEAGDVADWLRWLRFTRPGITRGTIAVLVEIDERALRRIEFGYAAAPPEVRERIEELARRWGYV
jgi:hypothetical protein